MPSVKNFRYLTDIFLLIARALMLLRQSCWLKSWTPTLIFVLAGLRLVKGRCFILKLPTGTYLLLTLLFWYQTSLLCLEEIIGKTQMPRWQTMHPKMHPLMHPFGLKTGF